MNKNALADAIVGSVVAQVMRILGNIASPFVYATFVAAEAVDGDL